MAGTMIEQAAAALATVDRCVEDAAEHRLTRQVFESRIGDALEIVSACMANLDSTQAAVTRQRISACVDKAWATAGQSDVNHWVRPYISKMMSIVRSGA